MGSSDAVHFVLRPNKNVERKLVVDALARLSTSFALRYYRYVGLGAFWFVDFLLFHRVLLIEEMISIERAENADRAKFNVPLKCIEVRCGDSTRVLPELDLGKYKSIVWLDHDSDLHGPVLEDCRIVCSESPAGSIILATLNVHTFQLKNKKDEREKDIPPLAVLRRVAPDLVPPDIQPKDLSVTKFPALVGRLLIAHMKHCTQKGQPSHRFVPLFNFYYRDNAPMVTVGGMIVNDSIEPTLRECRLPDQCEFVTGETQFSIEVPPLTNKEKFAMDRLMPCLELPAATFRANLGFDMKDTQLNAYRCFYRHYPIFGEMQ